MMTMPNFRPLIEVEPSFFVTEVKPYSYRQAFALLELANQANIHPVRRKRMLANIERRLPQGYTLVQECGFWSLCPIR